MAGETVITVVGNVTADPELRFTANGAAVANFTVASTPRTFDRQTSEWRDGETLFLRCSGWREMAENVAETLSRGTRVVARRAGRESRTFDTKEGERRTVFELDVDEVGPSLRYASANVTKNERGGGFQRRWPGRPAGRIRWRRPGWRPAGRVRRRPAPPSREASRAVSGEPARGRADALRRRTRGRRRTRRAVAVGADQRRTTVLIVTSTFHTGAHHGEARTSQAQQEDRPTRSSAVKPHDQLQGHRDPAEVHLGPRQDPFAPRHRGLRPGAATHREGREERPRDGAAALHRRRPLKEEDRDGKADPHPRGHRLGGAGDVVEVRAGYARNQLVPRGLATRWTKGGQKQVDALRKARQARQIADRDEALALKGKIESTTARIEMKSGKGGRLFGAVTSALVADAVSTAVGAQFDRRQVAQQYVTERSAEEKSRIAVLNHLDERPGFLLGKRTALLNGNRIACLSWFASSWACSLVERLTYFP